MTLIGIAGAGKSTLAPLIAEALGWESLDTDHVIEATYGRPLQEILEALGRREFLNVEEKIVSRLSAARCVVSTGGSVVYSEKIMERLRLLGPIVWLDVSLETFLERVGKADDRGFVCPEGMTIADVYNERAPLYEKYSDIRISTEGRTPEACVRELVEQLRA